MLIIPTQAFPSQTFRVVLDQQGCRIDIGQKSTGMFLNLYVDDALIVGGQICQDRNRLVRGRYLPFRGNLMFIDTQGTDDPYYTGLNSRWLLVYLEATDPP
jgi:hypothetical protein